MRVGDALAGGVLFAAIVIDRVAASGLRFSLPSGKPMDLTASVALELAAVPLIAALLWLPSISTAPARVGLVISTALDVLNGVPSIVIGVFVYALLVVQFRQSAFIASIALGIIMLPLVSRATQEVLALVPQSLVTVTSTV